MLLVSALFTAALLTQEKPAVPAKPADKPTVDRSAEPALREIFASVGALRNIHFRVEYYNREPDSSRWDDDSSADFWIGDGGRFRMYHQYNYWGGGQIVISDGESILTDNMDEDSAVTIARAKPTIHETSDQEPIMYLLEGAKGFDALVSKDKPVKLVDSKDPTLKAIEMNCNMGLVRFYVNASNVPVRIETVLPPWYANDPNNDNPFPNEPYALEKIFVVGSGHLDQSLFIVKPPKGRKVDDQRVKKEYRRDTIRTWLR